MLTDLEPTERLEHAFMGVWLVVRDVESDVADLLLGQQRLDARVENLATDLNAKIDGVEQRLNARIDGVEAKIERLDQRMDVMTGQLVAIAVAVGAA